MAIDKKIDYEIQGGVRNYRPSEMITAPKIAKSSPDTPTAKLAYITPEEEDILIDLNLYGSLKGKPNRGPSGLPSLEGDFGGPGGFGGFQGGGDYSSAETGNSSGFDGTGGGPKLPPGVNPKGSQLAQDLRSSFIAAGGGQRVNPGFFDSRNTISPIELARARNFNNPFARQAMRNTRGGGLMGFLSSGGILGNIIRSIGQKFGLGKTYDQPTYDMSRYSNLPLGGSLTFENLDIRDKFDRRNTGIMQNIDPYKYSIEPQPVNLKTPQYFENVPYQEPDFYSDAVAELTNKQKKLLDQRRGMYPDILGDQEMLDNISSENDPDNPATIEDIRKYYGVA
ncbi:MAG TPA: hypothetical protein VMX17_03205 [Candidatus Glassbacteria bacterium]|nr:hypothetical protein [Candidatus Glassbacteria bacterium]